VSGAVLTAVSATCPVSILTDKPRFQDSFKENESQNRGKIHQRSRTQKLLPSHRGIFNLTPTV
jgi:hypothetical protein